MERDARASTFFHPRSVIFRKKGRLSPMSNQANLTTKGRQSLLSVCINIIGLASNIVEHSKCSVAQFV